MESRYADDPRVKIDPAVVPKTFRHLVPLACKWAICDDLERQRFLQQSTAEEKRELVDAVELHGQVVVDWEGEQNRLVPVPDEAVIFGWMMLAAMEAWRELERDVSA